MSSAPPPALDFATATVNQALSAEQKIGLFTLMVRIRRFEQTALKFYNGGKMGGFSTFTSARSPSPSAPFHSPDRTTISSPPTATTATPSLSA